MFSVLTGLDCKLNILNTAVFKPADIICIPVHCQIANNSFRSHGLRVKHDIAEDLIFFRIDFVLDLHYIKLSAFFLSVCELMQVQGMTDYIFVCISFWKHH